MPEARIVTLDSDLSVLVDDTGPAGKRPVLILHGGGGPATVQPIANHLQGSARVLLPTHPGWNGTPRPARLDTVAGLADLYVRLLAMEDLRDVTVVGSSIGGWTAAEIALRDTEHRIGRLLLIDSVGVAVEGSPVRDFFSLDARGVAEYSFHDADRFYVDPTTLAPDVVDRTRRNLATLRVYAGQDMVDPTLLARLGGITVPTLVLWGASDRISTPAYGRALAAAIRGARFSLIADAGHLPYLEQPDSTFRALDEFLQVTAG